MTEERKAQASPVDALVAGVLAADRSALGRAITLVESTRAEDREAATALLSALTPHGGAAHRVGITGSPGAGKSTLIDAFGVMLTEQGHRVAVLAVDPSSTRTGGSILGDKTRMPNLARSDAAFIRPSPSGGTLGGVARRTRETMTVVEAAGFDVVLVETVGVGQSETVVADMVDTFVVLTLAGGGDELQGIKRGILELADVVAITKADGDNVAPAQRARAEYAQALRLVPPRDENWVPRVIACSAVTGDGLSALWEALQARRTALQSSGRWEARRKEQSLRWMWRTVEEELVAALRSDPDVAAVVPDLERAVLAGRLGPEQAAARVLEVFRRRASP